MVNRRYCDSVVRSKCRVPIDTAISLLEREIGSAVETRGHLATSYGTANRQPSRQSNPAHLCAALAVIRHIRTNVMVLNTSAIEKYEAAFAQYMDDATDPAHELTEALAHCPRTCCGKNAMRGFVLKQFPFPSAIAPGPGSWKSWRLLSAGRWAGPVSNWNPAASVFFSGPGPPTHPGPPFFCGALRAPTHPGRFFLCAHWPSTPGFSFLANPHSKKLRKPPIPTHPPAGGHQGNPGNPPTHPPAPGTGAARGGEKRGACPFWNCPKSEKNQKIIK